MEVKPKNPKRVEQGKKLALHNKERFAREKREKEERKRIEDEEFEKAADEFEAWKKQKDDDVLTIQEKEEEKASSSKMTVFLPVLALSIIGVGTVWYYRVDKKPEPKRSERPKILSRLEKF